MHKVRLVHRVLRVQLVPLVIQERKGLLVQQVQQGQQGHKVLQEHRELLVHRVLRVQLVPLVIQELQVQ